MIGIIAAMQIEAEHITARMHNRTTETVSGINYERGTVGEKEIVVAVCGIGKVFAAVCTQTMILRYSPELIINTGVGGAIGSELTVFDIVIGESVVQHDMNTTAIGDARGFLSGINRVYIPCDTEAGEQIKQQAEALDIRCFTGIIASGDLFVSKMSTKEKIASEFKAMVCEMEGAAIGQVCFINHIPFVVIRAISDSADGSADVDYPTFAKQAAAKSAEMLLHYLGA